MTQKASAHKVSNAARWAALTLAFGLIVSALFTWRQAMHNRVDLQTALDAQADHVMQDITAAMKIYEYGLRGARGAVLSAGHTRITREIFRLYSTTRDISTEFAGARGFGFIRRVRAPDLDAFLQSARRDGFPDFNVRSLTPHGGELYIIQYIEPVADNLPAVGLDIASEENRRVAAERSASTGEVALTGPITLVQGPEIGQQSFLILIPIYDSFTTPATEAERLQRLVGWSYAPLSMKDVFARLNVDSAALMLGLADVTDPEKAETFFKVGDDVGSKTIAQSVATLNVFGREWRMTLAATPLFAERLKPLAPSTVLLVGTLTTLLSAAVILLINVGRQRQRAIRAEQARMAAIVENSSDPIIAESLEGRITSWNRAAERLFGYKEEQVLDRPLAVLLLPPDRRHEDANILEQISREGAVTSFETVRIDRNSNPIDVSVTASPIRDPDGTIVGVAKLFRDIRQQKEESRRLSDFNQQLEREVFQRTEDLNRTNVFLNDVLRAASEVSIIATETDGMIRIFNEGAQRMLGYAAEDIVGKHTPALIHLPEEVAARGKELTAQFGIQIEGFRTFTYIAEMQGSEKREWTYVRKDGSHLRVSLLVTTMRDENNVNMGYLGIAMDVTEQHQAIEALREAKFAADSANSAKSRFLAMMSHELRTPLTGVLGITDLLMTTGLGPEQQEMLRTQAVSANSLLNLINDILDFAKIEAGKVDLESIHFSIEQQVENVVALMAPIASERGVTIDFNIDESVEDAYRGDAMRYRQILMNLVGNASKFTTRGRIDIEVRQIRREGADVEVETSVSDTGVGIAPEFLDQLFQPFVQAEAATSRKFGGTGLGLTISKSLAELMGGRIWATSEPGKGSVFRFTVLLQPGNVSEIDTAVTAPKQGVSPAQLPQAARSLKILVAEDNYINRLLLTAILTRLGHTVLAVENGALAVSQINQEPCDIILMDMQMPVMDGMAATKLIRERKDDRSRIPIIALTADALRENHHLYISSGVNAVITKPIDWRYLHGALERLTSSATAETLAGDAEAPLPLASVTVPILDHLVLDELATLIEPEKFAAMGAKFERAARKLVQSLLSESNGPAEIKAHAHSLKGLAAQFGAMRLCDLAAEIERGADRLEIAEVISRLGPVADESVAAVRQAIQKL